MPTIPINQKKTAAVVFADFTKEETKNVEAILGRAEVFSRRFGRRFDALSLEMDLAAVHAHTPLRLADLADADDLNFTHDVVGIMKHIDRATGQLLNCFVPRFAMPAARS